MSVIPSAVGRLDDVVDAIRDGDRERARELLNAEQNRLSRKYFAMAVELDKCRKACSQVADFETEIGIDQFWHEARVACGWHGVDGFEGPIENLTVSAGDVSPELKWYEVVDPHKHKSLKRGDRVHVTQDERLWNCLYRDDGTLHVMQDGNDQYAHLSPLPPAKPDNPLSAENLATDLLEVAESMLNAFDNGDRVHIYAFDKLREIVKRARGTPVKPALKAEKLPIGTVMVLGGLKYHLEKWCKVTSLLSFVFASGVYNFNPSEIQELIDRGVEFRLPKGGEE
jgi:hypothetical protein